MRFRRFPRAIELELGVGYASGEAFNYPQFHDVLVGAVFIGT
jgi:hypothetical protein